VTGSKQRGTTLAARMGQGFALLLGAIALKLMASNGAFSGLWLLAVALLLWQSARGAIVQSAMAARIERVRVSDIMDHEPVAIPSAAPVAQAEEEYFLRYGWNWFPVVDDVGHFLGIVRRERLDSVGAGADGWLTVAAAVDADAAANCRVQEDRPITDVLASESLGRLGALMAVDREGVLRGVVTAKQVRRALQAALQGPLL
jgi:predicted transcriptional regulator